MLMYSRGSSGIRTPVGSLEGLRYAALTLIEKLTRLKGRVPKRHIEKTLLGSRYVDTLLESMNRTPP